MVYCFEEEVQQGVKAWEEVLAPEQGDGGRGRCYDGGGGCGVDEEVEVV